LSHGPEHPPLDAFKREYGQIDHDDDQNGENDRPRNGSHRGGNTLGERHGSIGLARQNALYNHERTIYHHAEIDGTETEQIGRNA